VRTPGAGEYRERAVDSVGIHVAALKMAPSCGEGSVSMKNPSVVEEHKVTRLQPVDYESPQILQQLGKLTVSGVKLF